MDEDQISPQYPDVVVSIFGCVYKYHLLRTLNCGIKLIKFDCIVAVAEGCLSGCIVACWVRLL